MGDRSIMLTDILEAYAETKGVFASITKLAIRLKDGEVIVCPLKKEGGSFSGFLNPELQFKADIERWVYLDLLNGLTQNLSEVRCLRDSRKRLVENVLVFYLIL